MENLSHSLVGVAVAESVWQARSRRVPQIPAGLKAAVFSLSVLANNLPDLDVFYSPFMDGKLGYLLHHRGHTHTVVGALAMGFALFALLWGWRSARGHLRYDRGDQWLLLGVCLMGVTLHLGMDWLNVYGVHPYWPWNNEWVYGDTLFIVEPLFWLLLTPPAFWGLKSRGWRGFHGAIFAVALFAVWGLGFVPAGVAAGVTVLGVCAALGLRVVPERWRAVTALGTAAAVVVVFSGARAAVTTRFADALQNLPAKRKTLALVASPMPSNPLCWRMIGVTTAAEKKRYEMPVAHVTAHPWFPVTRVCPDRMKMNRITAPLQPLASALGSPSLAWQGKVSGSIPRLRSLFADNCRIRGFMKFVRAPFLVSAEDTGAMVFGDLRFDRDEGLGFAEEQVNREPRDCPSLLPPWVPPRMDLLGKE